MAETKDFGRFFFYFARVHPGSPLLHTATTVMVEPPYHRGVSIIVRLPLRHALIAGVWRRSGWGEEEALMEAVSGWGVDPWDDTLETDEVKQVIRENVAAQIEDLDTEWQVIAALGADQ